MVAALLTAAGSGVRMGQDIPKQFMPINNKPMIIYTLERFQTHPEVDAIIAVTIPEWIEVLKAYAAQYGITKLRWVVPGGASNQESIRNGLQCLRQDCEMQDTVIIHDGNRCRVSGKVITDALATFRKHGSAVAAVPCVEAVFISEDGNSASSFIPREKIIRTQTPHVYTLGKLLWAHEEAMRRNISDTTATCTLMSELGEEIFFSRGSEENFKLTTTDDVRLFRAYQMMGRSEIGWKEYSDLPDRGGYYALLTDVSATSGKEAA